MAFHIVQKETLSAPLRRSGALQFGISRPQGLQGAGGCHGFGAGVGGSDLV